ncbi:MAG TPA: HEAT repeat domain-containing protein [Elusimicrobiales bacterium]|nr:HEAT repeat domain-containing protein [Elusimicrobiales bacterium]
MRSRKPGDRHEALERMRRGKDRVKTEELNSAFSRETDPVLKTGMLRIMAASSGAERDLISALKNDPSFTVRQSAAQELGRYARSPAVVAALSEALRKDNALEVRTACALSLAFSDTPEADDALDLASKDRAPDLRRQAAFSLKRHKSAKAAAALKRLARDPDASVRSMAKK